MKVKIPTIGAIQTKIRTVFENFALNRHWYTTKEKAWLQSSEYEQYLDTQLQRTYTKRDTQLPDRTVKLIDTVGDHVNLAQTEVLCVGVRNINEIEYFQKKGVKSIVGIDLFSEHELVEVMDMHDMSFSDNQFDLIYSCHSFEHAFDVQRVAQEFVRVCRPGAAVVIEVPVQFDVRGADLVDFGSYENILQAFQPHVDSVMWAENAPAPKPGHPAVAKVIFRVAK